MRSRLVTLVKLFTLELDKFVIRSGGSKPTETAKEPEKRKSKAQRDKDYDRKRTRLFKDSWFSDFTWLRKDDNLDTLYCHVCRMFPQSADTTSALYTGKSIETLLRKDTLTAHQTSSKHVSCVSKYEFKQKPSKQGPIEKSISKVEMHEISRYKKLFNTAYAVIKHNRPYSDYTFLCDVQKKNGADLGNDHLSRDTCVVFQNSISNVLLNETKANLKNVRYFSVMSDSSTDSSVIDQEGILLRYVHPETYEPVTSIASIENLENATADGVVDAVKRGLMKCDIDIDNLSNQNSKLVCMNLDGAAVNLGAKNGVAKKLSDSVDNKVVVTHCVAHKLELGVLDAVKQVGYLKKFEDTLKRICKFYSFSPKRREELKRLASFLDETLKMHTEIKAIRWVSSKLRALEAVCQDINVTVTHMEQILETSNRADELGQAKAILTDLKSVKFVKYIHLMLDVLTAITKVSVLFQNKDLLLFEVKEAVDTLYMNLHVMTNEPGEHLSKFYSLYDPETSLFDGKFKLTGSLCEFKDDNDIHSLFEKISQYVLERFKDLDCPPLSLYKIFDFRNWPHTLADLSTYGCKEIKQLCEHCNDLLTEEEVNSIPNEWQTLKVQVSMQRTYHPLAVYISILQRKEDSVKHINALLQLLLTISPSTAACERLFSQMNLVKSPLRTRLTQENLQSQMRIVISGPEFSKFDPLPSVEEWLKSGHRHIRHKPPERSATVTSESVASTSAQASSEMESIQPMLTEIVKTLGGEDIAREKLKALSDNPSNPCALM